MNDKDNFPCDHNRVFNSPYFNRDELTNKQQLNPWLKNRDTEQGIYADYPTYDYSYNYYVCKTTEELKQCFLYGNWSIRQCFIYKNLAFINQVNGGCEWWTVKKFNDGSLLPFESVTFTHYDYKKHENCLMSNFEEYIGRMIKATYEQCKMLEY